MNYQTASQAQHQTSSGHAPVVGILQRKCACGQHTAGGATCDECGKNQLQRRASGESKGGQIPPIVHDVLRSPGKSLDSNVRSFMEPRFGQDFSHVRIHTDSRAAQSAASVDALAYTVGSNIVFGHGMYSPGTATGAHLLAHEMAHVVQQRSITAPLSKYGIGADDSTYEREADRHAEHIMRNGSVAHLSKLSAPTMQRAKICSKQLQAPVVGMFANHSYIDDTGREDCKGSSMAGNYAVQTLVSGNFYRGCAAKTDHSTDPQSYTPNVKPCEPKSGVSNVSRCLRDAYNAYADPSVYSNEEVTKGAGKGAVVGGVIGGVLGGLTGLVGGALGGAYVGARRSSFMNGPNSNTFAATLAKACCADSSSNGLGWVPGWDHAPATPCAMASGGGGGTPAGDDD